MNVSYPILAALFKALLSTYLGSPSKGFPSAVYTSQMSLAVFPISEFHGSMTNESVSGDRYMSDSSILTNPSMDEPSNIHLLSRAFSSCFAVIATFFSMPKMSVNWSLMNSTFSSLTIFMISSFVYLDIWYTSAI